jgi:hypothetical protein
MSFTIPMRRPTMPQHATARLAPSSIGAYNSATRASFFDRFLLFLQLFAVQSTLCEKTIAAHKRRHNVQYAT